MTVYRVVPLDDVSIADEVRYDGEEIAPDLVASIRDHGVIEPLVVTPDGAGAFVLLAGRRRLRHARAAGLDEVPVIVRGTEGDLDAFMISVEENLHRRDWSPVEIGRIAERFASHGWTQAEIAAYLDERMAQAISRPHISQYVKLLGMVDLAQAATADGRLSFSAAREISRLNDLPEMQASVTAQVLAALTDGGLTVRSIARRVDRALMDPEDLAAEREAATVATAGRVYEGARSEVARERVSEKASERESDTTRERVGADKDPIAAAYLAAIREGVEYLAEAGRLEDIELILEEARHADN